MISYCIFYEYTFDKYYTSIFSVFFSHAFYRMNTHKTSQIPTLSFFDFLAGVAQVLREKSPGEVCFSGDYGDRVDMVVEVQLWI